MEHCYRIALWMFCFIAYIQAMYIPDCLVPTKDDLRLSQLQDVKCKNATFLSQSTAKANDSEVLRCIIPGLKQASAQCTQKKLINHIVEYLEPLMECPQFAATNSSEPMCETRTMLKELVNDVESFVEKQPNKNN